MAEAEEVFAPRSVLLPGRRSLMVRLTCNEGMRPAPGKRQYNNEGGAGGQMMLIRCTHCILNRG